MDQHDVPFEFQPNQPANDHIAEENLDMFGSMFATEVERTTISHCERPSSNDDEIDDATNVVSVELAGVTFSLLQPPDIGTFFAHQIWSGSKLLAEYMHQHDHLVLNKSTVELGAGTGLPSLMALRLQSKVSVLTDYPNDEMMQSLRETVGLNWNLCRRRVPDHMDSDGQQPNRLPSPEQRVAVVGHAWGTPTEPVLRALESLLLSTWSSTSLMTCNEDDARKLTQQSTCGSIRFDVALLSECLWNHALHARLAQSLDQLLHPQHGFALLTYAHHIPGLEEQDDAFFDLCEKRHGFQTTPILSKAMPYMWDDTKSIEIHLKLLSRVSDTDM